MAQFPYLPFFRDAWVADTLHLTCQQEGIYWRLIYTMWATPGCRLPNDHEWLIRHLRLSSTDAVELEPLIREYCTNDGNWITQKRLRKEFSLAFQRRGRLSVLNKRRKNIKKDSNRSCSTAPVEREPHCNLNLNLRDKSLTLEREEASNQNVDQQPPRSLATALPTGALAHSAQNTASDPSNQQQSDTVETNQPSDKTLEDMTLAEINKRWRGVG
jgi:uncharacterized protein YdaU (DUF1376 family)